MIGNGIGVDVRNDPWVPSLENYKPTGVGSRIEGVGSVADLFLEDTRT